MASLGLKLFYLRTREKNLSQRDAAAQLGVRQATISHLEQGRTSPHWALILALCQFYDVTPTFLADEDRGVVPRTTERWGLRDSLVTLGMWLEVDDEEVETLDGSSLCRLAPGASFYDEEALALRREHGGREAAGHAIEAAAQAQRDVEAKLEKHLELELTKHPRRRGKVDS